MMEFYETEFQYTVSTEWAYIMFITYRHKVYFLQIMITFDFLIYPHTMMAN